MATKGKIKAKRRGSATGVRGGRNLLTGDRGPAPVRITYADGTTKTVSPDFLAPKPEVKHKPGRHSVWPEWTLCSDGWYERSR